MVTAAHLGEIEGYTCVWIDPDTDYAIYVVNDYAASSLKEGDSVTLVQTTGTVTSVLEKEFTVVVDNVAKIVPGVSGEPVYLDGVPVGFISGWNGSGALRCIFY